jgi:glycolate oxidase subunit GlcD
VAVASSTAIERELRAVLGDEAVLPGDTRQYLTDATESRNLRGRADAIALPRDAHGVAQTVAWCYEHDVPIVPRGGGSGLAGGAVPVDGGVVVSLERLNGPPRLEPELWRAWVPAGVTTAELRRRARENGLLYPPDPGAAEQSQLGGNIATNAGGPHTFKYGVTGRWVTGLDLVLAPGEPVTVGGAVRKDVAGYDIRSLVVGSEGTLGIVTGAWIRLTPAPEEQLPVVAFFAGTDTGCEALATVMASGLLPAALEYLDEATMAAAGRAFPGGAPDPPPFVLIAEADGSHDEARRLRAELLEALAPTALATHAPEQRREIDELWRWRSGVSLAVIAARNGKVSEDIAVPLDRMAEAIRATREIGARHGLPACSWGHAGDGNLHSTFMIDRDDPAETRAAEDAAQELFELAIALGGTVSGEHGLGLVKRGALARQWPAAAVELHESIKRVFDPKGLLNPGKKLAR